MFVALVVAGFTSATADAASAVDADAAGALCSGEDPQSASGKGSPSGEASPLSRRMKLDTAVCTPALKAAALRAGPLTAPSMMLAMESILSVMSATSFVMSSTFVRLALTPSRRDSGLLHQGHSLVIDVGKDLVDPFESLGRLDEGIGHGNGHEHEEEGRGVAQDLARGHRDRRECGVHTRLLTV